MTVTMPRSDNTPPQISLQAEIPELFSVMVGPSTLSPSKVLLPDHGLLTFTASAEDSDGGTKKVILDGEYTVVCKDVFSSENEVSAFPDVLHAETTAPGADLSTPGDKVFIHLNAFAELDIDAKKSNCPANNVFVSLAGHIDATAENYFGGIAKTAVLQFTVT